jgi:hypothetical protein
MTRMPGPEKSIHHLQTITHHSPAAQVHMSRDRAIIVLRGILQLAEARHWKLCTHPRLSVVLLFDRDESGRIFLDSDDG